MARRPGAIGPGYLPKGGRRVALDMAAKRAAENLDAVDGNLAAAGPTGQAGRPSPRSASNAIESPAGGPVRGRAPAPAVTTEGLALIGALAGLAALVGELVHVITG